MRLGSLSTLAAVVALAGCGSGDDETGTPVVCSGGEREYRAALDGAPGEVLLEGETPVADCIVGDQSAGDLADVGSVMVAVATELNRQAREDPAGEATVQLGYLVGAVQEAAAQTGGIHEDLVIRLDSAARLSPGGQSFGAEFERAFGEGYAAAQAAG